MLKVDYSPSFLSQLELLLFLDLFPFSSGHEQMTRNLDRALATLGEISMMAKKGVCRRAPDLDVPDLG